jgi:tyrosyl-tRNA synthetase
MKANFIEELRWRGLLKDASEGAEEAVIDRKHKLYIGFDPTADSLHVGSLLQIMSLVRAQQHGHTPIALVGGATGMIGDPSGKSEERNLLDVDTLNHNVACLRDQLARFLDFETTVNPAQMANNFDWFKDISYIDFLRDTGKNFTLAYMMGKESVKRRLTEGSISYTEFSYMLLQSYDFLHLYDHHGVTLQMGGSDQWGNITAGSELIRRAREGKAYGIVTPLIMTASGQKFGKTAEGAVWLDANRTSPYKFYQYFMNTDDADVVQFLKFFTHLEEEDINTLAEEVERAAHKRVAQRRLAEEVTRMVHGEDALTKVQEATKVIFGGDISALGATEIAEIFENVPSTEIARTRFEGEGVGVLQLFTDAGLTKSNGEARRLLQGGGINVNNNRVSDPKANVTLEQTIEGRYLVLRKGSKNYHLLQIV